MMPKLSAFLVSIYLMNNPLIVVTSLVTNLKQHYGPHLLSQQLWVAQHGVAWWVSFLPNRNYQFSKMLRTVKQTTHAYSFLL